MKKIQILGTGCPKCDKLTELTREAAASLRGDFEIEKVTEINRITAAGVIMTPALMVDGTVKVVGRVPDLDEIKKLIG